MLSINSNLISESGNNTSYLEFMIKVTKIAQDGNNYLAQD